MELSEYNLTQDEIDTLTHLYKVGEYCPGSNDKHYQSLGEKGLVVCLKGYFNDELYRFTSNGKAIAEQLKNDYTDNSSCS